MAEYIDREAAIQVVKHAWSKGLEPSQYIEIIPSADVEPVKHGKWRWSGEDKWNDCYECSSCGKICLDNSKYCPNCGALMDKEDEHEAD